MQWEKELQINNIKDLLEEWKDGLLDEDTFYADMLEAIEHLEKALDFEE